MNRKAVIALLTVSAMAVSSLGLGTIASADEVQASTSDLNIMIETPVESLDPQQATDGTSFEVIADFTDGLMQMDEDGAAVPALAESYEVSEDGL